MIYASLLITLNALQNNLSVTFVHLIAQMKKNMTETYLVKMGEVNFPTGAANLPTGAAHFPTGAANFPTCSL